MLESTSVYSPSFRTLQTSADSVHLESTCRAPEDAHDFVCQLMALRGELYGRALRLTRNSALAEDLLQDAIERALRFRDQFARGTSLRSWAHTIVFSLFVTSYRRRRREHDAMRTLATDPCAWTLPVSPSADAISTEFSPSLRRAVDRLPEPFRDVLLMVDVRELTYQDAADELRIPIGTVMSRLHRARRQMAEVLGADEGAAIAA